MSNDRQKTRIEGEPGSEAFVWPVGFSKAFSKLKEQAPQINDSALELALYHFIYNLAPIDNWFEDDNPLFSALNDEKELADLIKQAQESDEAEKPEDFSKRYKLQRIPIYNNQLEPDIYQGLLILAFKPNPGDSTNEGLYIPNLNWFEQTLSHLKNSFHSGGKQALKQMWDLELGTDERLNFQHVITKIHESDNQDEWKKLSPEDLEIITNLAQVGKQDLELGVSKQIAETLWYMEKMEIPAKARSGILQCLLRIEPFYRGGFRKAENSKRDQDPSTLKEKPEAAFNHFLSVIRIALGLINLARINKDIYNETQLEYYKIFEDPAVLVTLCLGAATHDFVEDFVSKADKEAKKGDASCARQKEREKADKEGETALAKILSEVIEIFDREPGMNGNKIKDNVLHYSTALNTFNYMCDRHEERDFKKYTHNILNCEAIPLKLIKFPDIIANKLSRPENRHETVNTEPKDLAYIDLIHKIVVEMGLIKKIPVRFVIDIVKNYPEWLEEMKAREFIRVWCKHFSDKDRVTWKNCVMEKMSEQVRFQVLLAIGPTGMPPKSAE